MADASATWTDERIELLKKLWSEGSSASQIAAAIGSVTRNAVIGKVHRLGLSGRGKAKSESQPRARKAPRAVSSTLPAETTNTATVRVLSSVRTAPTPLKSVDDDVVVPLSERVTIMDLRESMCRWPMGDPTTPEFRFCGARSITGLPYCSHHSRIAYQPVAERKRDRDRKLARA